MQSHVLSENEISVEKYQVKRLRLFDLRLVDFLRRILSEPVTERGEDANWFGDVHLTSVELFRFRCFWTLELMFDELAPTDRIDVAWSTVDPLFEVFIPTIEMKTNEIISDLSNACHTNQMRGHHVHRFKFHTHCKWIRYFFLLDSCENWVLVGSERYFHNLEEMSRRIRRFRFG